MHILRSIHLACALNVCLSRKRFLDEVLYPLLTFSMTLYRLNNDAVRRTT
jgi:hypothetical protein